MMTPTATVFVIDDDEAVRRNLGRLLGAAHYRIEHFKSASEFLSRSAHPGPVVAACLNGCEFQVTRLVITGCSINKLALSSERRKRPLKPIAAMLCRSWGSLR